MLRASGRIGPKHVAGHVAEVQPARSEAGAVAVRLIVRAPDALLACLMALCVAVTVALALRDFTPWLVAPLWIAFALPIVWLTPPAPSESRPQTVGALLSIAGAILWVLLNVPYAAQMLWVTRDPGIYTVLGIWLGHHQSLGIDGHQILQLRDQVSGISASLHPFAYDDRGIAYAQGSVTLPGLLGVGDWLGGTQGVLHTNLIVGGIGLVGVYALARRFVRPSLALVAQAALALTVAYIYLIRAPYSESILLVSGVGATVWFVAALRSSRTDLALIGGLFVGTGSTAR